MNSYLTFYAFEKFLPNEFSEKYPTENNEVPIIYISNLELMCFYENNHADTKVIYNKIDKCF